VPQDVENGDNSISEATPKEHGRPPKKRQNIVEPDNALRRSKRKRVIGQEDVDDATLDAVPPRRAEDTLPTEDTASPLEPSITTEEVTAVGDHPSSQAQVPAQPVNEDSPMQVEPTEHEEIRRDAVPIDPTLVPTEPREPLAVQDVTVSGI
jgi:hypothetical protein